MTEEKEYSVKRNIVYERKQGLGGLIHEGYQRLVRGGFKPRFLHFKGEDVNVRVTSPEILSLSYFDPNEIGRVGLSYGTETSEELREKIVAHFLDYRHYQEGTNEFFVTLHVFPDSESPCLYGLRLYPCIKKLGVFRRRNMGELDGELERFADLLGIKDPLLKGKRSKNKTFLKREGTYDSFDLSRDVIFNTYNRLLEGDKPFCFEAFTFLGYSQMVSLRLNGENQDFSISSKGNSNLLDGLEDLLPDKIQFSGIGYDSQYYRKLVEELTTKERVFRRLLKGRHTANLSREEIQTRLEKRYYQIYRRRKIEKFAREHAKTEAHVDSYRMLNFVDEK